MGDIAFHPPKTVLLMLRLLLPQRGSKVSWGPSLVFGVAIAEKLQAGCQTSLSAFLRPLCDPWQVSKPLCWYPLLFHSASPLSSVLFSINLVSQTCPHRKFQVHIFILKLYSCFSFSSGIDHYSTQPAYPSYFPILISIKCYFHPVLSMPYLNLIWICHFYFHSPHIMPRLRQLS